MLKSCACCWKRVPAKTWPTTACRQLSRSQRGNVTLKFCACCWRHVPTKTWSTTTAFTALTLSAAQGHVEVARLLLLEARADGNVSDGRGWTALTTASRHGHVRIVGLLLEAGADINLADNRGFTASTTASRHGHDEVVRLLDAATARSS